MDPEVLCLARRFVVAGDEVVDAAAQHLLGFSYELSVTEALFEPVCRDQCRNGVKALILQHVDLSATVTDSGNAHLGDQENHIGFAQDRAGPCRPCERHVDDDVVVFVLGQLNHFLRKVGGQCLERHHLIGSGKNIQAGLVMGHRRLKEGAVRAVRGLKNVENGQFVFEVQRHGGIPELKIEIEQTYLWFPGTTVHETTGGLNRQCRGPRTAVGPDERKDPMAGVGRRRRRIFLGCRQLQGAEKIVPGNRLGHEVHDPKAHQLANAGQGGVRRCHDDRRGRTVLLNKARQRVQVLMVIESDIHEQHVGPE